MSVLELKDISGGYGEADILHGVTLTIGEGEIVVVIGPNGAGKSTAMKAVFGLLRLSGGTITLAGEDITGMDPARVVRKGVCYVPQTNNVFSTLTVQENLEMGAYIREDNFKPRIQEIYEMFPPLAEKRKQRAGELSGGQRQMVAMGKALMVEPKILLLDEPTAGLSPIYRKEIFDTVRQINATGIPILMVEQNAKQSLAVADRGKGSDLLQDPENAEMFLGG